MSLEKVRNWFFGYGFLIMGGLVILLIGINVVVLGIGLGRGETVAGTSELSDDECGKECVLGIVREEMAGVVVSPTLEKEPVEEVGVSKSVTKAAREEFVRLSDGLGSGSEWVSVGEGKWFDVSLYGELQSASWEGWAEIPGGSGIVYIRLYDATNSRAVDGSEVMIKDTARTSFYSRSLALWRGQNQYFVQVRSSSGGSVGVSEARVKLVVR